MRQFKHSGTLSFAAIVPGFLTQGLPDQMRVGWRAIWIMLFAKASPCARDGFIFRIRGEIQQDERFSLAKDGDRALVVVADIRFERDDPSVGMDFFAGKDDLAPIHHFGWRVAEKTGLESDLAGLIRDDVNEDAIRLRAGDDGAGNRGFPDKVGGTDPVFFPRSIFEIYRRHLPGNPTDAKLDRGIDAFHPHRQFGRVQSVRDFAGQTSGFDLFSGRNSRCHRGHEKRGCSQVKSQ